MNNHSPTKNMFFYFDPEDETIGNNVVDTGQREWYRTAAISGADFWNNACLANNYDASISQTSSQVGNSVPSIKITTEPINQNNFDALATCQALEVGTSTRGWADSIITIYTLNFEYNPAQNHTDRAFKIMAHEFGHAFGLDHCEQPDVENIMQPAIGLGSPRIISSQEIWGLKVIFGDHSHSINAAQINTTSPLHNITCTSGCGLVTTEHHTGMGWTDNGGGHTGLCTRCGLQVVNLEHYYNDFDFLSDDYHVKTCANCGHHVNERHNLYKWAIFDESEHWAFCNQCLSFYFGTHILGDWSYNSSSHVGYCTECGYEMVSDKHSIFVSYNSYQHTTKCKICPYVLTNSHSFIYTDISSSSHSITCKDCSYYSSESHSYGSWEYDTPIKHMRECICGRAQFVKHTFPSWTSDGLGHTGRCGGCNADVTQPHNFGIWRDDGAYDHTRTCSDCGYKDYESHAKYWAPLNGCTRCGRKDPIALPYSTPIALLREEYINPKPYYWDLIK